MTEFLFSWLNYLLKYTQ